MTLVPALDPANPEDFFLFVSNDNDFITQNGYQVGAPYKDESGADIDTIVLVYRLNAANAGEIIARAGFCPRAINTCPALKLTGLYPA